MNELWQGHIGNAIGLYVYFFAPGSDGNGSICRGKIVGQQEHDIYGKQWVLVDTDDTDGNTNTRVLVNPDSLLELNYGLWGSIKIRKGRDQSQRQRCGNFYGRVQKPPQTKVGIDQPANNR